jgi:hypothetical protein
MQMAIAAYMNKKIGSESRVTAIFGVPKSTLLFRLKGIKLWSVTRASGHKLTGTEEQALVKRLLDADNRGFSFRLEFLREMAQKSY